jgi:hypothetical protein
MRFYQDFNILIERHKKTEKALHRKLPKLATQHLGDVGLADAEEVGGLDLFQAALSHERVDFENELRLDEVLVRIPQAEILEHVPATAFVSLLAHGSLSFAICSASRSRCFTTNSGNLRKSLRLDPTQITGFKDGPVVMGYNSKYSDITIWCQGDPNSVCKALSDSSRFRMNWMLEKNIHLFREWWQLRTGFGLRLGLRYF